MQKYHIAAVLTLHTGTLELSDAQYARRKHALKKVGKGKYEIVTPVQFKVGEVVGYEGDIPKALATVMIDEAEEKKDNAKKAKTEAAAKAKAKAEADAKAELEARFIALEAEIKALQSDLSKAENATAAAEIEASILSKAAELDSLIG